MSDQTRLDLYDNSWYSPGANPVKRLLWYFVNVLIFNNGLFPLSGLKVSFLRIFGAKVGTGVVIKPSVNIKYPWHLELGDYTWVGEGVWIDNLTTVSLGRNCCLSQGAMLLTGNHNYKRSSFDLLVGEIYLEDGVWIGAKAIVCPGVRCHSHSVLSAGSVATKNLEAFTSYHGNPAQEAKKRVIK